MLEHAAALARAAHEETGLGRVEDKVVKNLLVTEKTPGPRGPLRRRPSTGDHGLSLIEPAPFGVIGAITPVTNPTSTIICNAIGMLAAGNAVVFNVHPTAQARARCRRSPCSTRRSRRPAGRRTSSRASPSPTIETAQEMMRHPAIRLLVVTGGGAVVKAAMASGKRAICAGPGQPAGRRRRDGPHRQGGPRHRARRVDRQQHHLHRREGSARASPSVADALIEAMAASGAVARRAAAGCRSSRTCSSPKMRGPRRPAEINRELIGKNAGVILGRIGMNVPGVDAARGRRGGRGATRCSGPSR